MEVIAAYLNKWRCLDSLSNSLLRRLASVAYLEDLDDGVTRKFKAGAPPAESAALSHPSLIAGALRNAVARSTLSANSDGAFRRYL